MSKGSGSLYKRPTKLKEMLLSKEDRYVAKRLLLSGFQSLVFYLNRIFPIDRKKIVFTAIEGTCGYMCNPKYIAEEFIRQGLDREYDLVWLVDDINKEFPSEIRVVENTLWNRAHELSTAKWWIDNSRKQLECRKRNGQIYIQTWHAKLGFKPTCLDRGDSFTKIAYVVSKHDSDMVDYWLSNSDWYDGTLLRGSLYRGKALHTGSPRCDILVKSKEDRVFRNTARDRLIKKYVRNSAKHDEDIHFVMYAPTFRGGSQETDRGISIETGGLDYDRVVKSLEKRFGGKWYILLRLHPQLSARKMTSNDNNPRLVDVSRIDDMYELLAGCDAFITDYSSAAFDASVMEMPVFLYCDDYADYENERGSLLWDMEKLPFPLSENNDELSYRIETFDGEQYLSKLNRLFVETGMVEDGKACPRIVEYVTSVDS